jgi:hypothetical protein
MIYCYDCRRFVKAKVYAGGNEATNPPETVCSECGSANIENADHCPYCGEFKLVANDMCDACDTTVAEITSEAINTLKDALDTTFENAKDLLMQYLDQ